MSGHSPKKLYGKMTKTRLSEVTPEEAIKSSISYDFTAESTVALHVGPDEQKMVAHGAKLTEHSKFFEAALNKNWTEGQTRTIMLKEESTTTMSHYLSFLYSGKLFTEDINIAEAQIEECYALLAHLYVAGERYLDRHLRAAVIKEFLRLSNTPDKDATWCWYPTGEKVNIIYRGTSDGSPARQLMVDMHVNLGIAEWMDYDLEAQFVIDVAKSFYGKFPSDGSSKPKDFRKKALDAKDYL